MKLEPQTERSLVAACALLLSAPVIHGAVVESFESGLNGWNAGTLNGTVTTVDSVRATDGTFSAANSFTVPASFSGWTVNNIIERDPRTFMDAGTTTLTMDVYADWTNPNGWGVYGNTIMLILNNSSGWTAVGPTSGSLVSGSFQTLSWDLTQLWGATSIAERITDPGLGWSSVGIAWHVGTWAGGGDALDNGTQTFAVDNIAIVPEPSSSALGVLGASLLVIRRRRR